MTTCQVSRRATILGLLAVVPSAAGCSVGKALSGEKQPDLSVCRVGNMRSDIEVQLGHPISAATLPDGSQSCTYEYQVGNEPSAGRAVAHGVMDVLTFGIWEAVGTPVEAIQGSTYRMTIVYDADGRAREIQTTKVSGTP